jgi:hypothetical protein
MSGPILANGEPFPTLMWLTCPWLVALLGRLESEGELEVWRERLSDDATLRAELLAADREYRLARAEANGGTDPCPAVGIAGQADPLAPKCLHAHAAAYVAGLRDPIGGAVLSGVRAECADDRCAAFRENATTRGRPRNGD